MNAKAKGPKVPQNSSAKAKKSKQRSRLSPYLEKIGQQFLLPGSGSGTDLEVSPASYPQQVCVRHLHKEVDVTSVELPDGFSVVMRPDLLAPGFITSQVALFIPGAGSGPLEAQGQLIGLSNGSNINEGFGRFTDNTDTQVLGELVPITDSVGTTYYGFVLTPSGACTLALDVIKRSLSPCIFSVYSKIAGGPWTLVNPAVGLPQHNVVNLDGALLANANAIAFAVTGQSDEFSAKFSMAFTNAQAVIQAVNGFAPSFDTFIIDNGITVGRVISMSMLAQNTSPDIANGGNINAGRVPYDFHPFGDDTVDELSGLPTNRRYQGRAAMGGYVNWMPSQYDEFEPDFIGEKANALASAEYLYLEVDGWGGGALTSSFKIHFDWIVEFYTPNQIFEKVLTPPRTPDFDMLFHTLLLMPAATCNPSHEDGWTDYLKKAGRLVKKGYEFYDEHAALIDSVLLTLAELAL